MDRREAWAVFMEQYQADKKTDLVQQIISRNEGIAAAVHVMNELTETERENIAEYIRLKRELDAKEDLLEMKETAREEGLAEGRAEGLAEGRTEGLVKGRAEGLAEGRAEAMKETARKLKAMGIPLEQITEVSGLSAETIASL